MTLTNKPQISSKNLGLACKQARLQKQLTVAELNFLFEYKNRSYVTRVESGYSTTTLKYMMRLSIHTGIPAWQILRRATILERKSLAAQDKTEHELQKAIKQAEAVYHGSH